MDQPATTSSAAVAACEICDADLQWREKFAVRFGNMCIHEGVFHDKTCAVCICIMALL